MRLNKVKQLLYSIQSSRGPDNKSLFRQVTEIMYLYRNGILAPDQYYDYELCKRSIISLQNLPYLGSKSYRKLDAALNPLVWVSLEKNKWLFHLHFEFLGLPLPKAYGFYDTRNGITADGANLRTKEDLTALLDRYGLEEMVIKPLHGGQGKGLLVLQKSCDGQFAALDGKSYSVGELSTYMASEAFLVQERVRQHGFLEAVNPNLLNTFRIVTFIDTAGEAHVHFCYLRLGRKGSNTDNHAGGGLVIYVDPETGELGVGRTKKDKACWTCHPDTGVGFSGLRIPLWKDVLALACKAAKVCPLGSVGWDIALTADGPVLIECNTGWEFKKAQTLTGYLQPSVRQQLAEYGIRQP